MTMFFSAHVGSYFQTSTMRIYTMFQQCTSLVRLILTLRKSERDLGLVLVLTMGVLNTNFWGCLMLYAYNYYTELVVNEKWIEIFADTLSRLKGAETGWLYGVRYRMMTPHRVRPNAPQ